MVGNSESVIPGDSPDPDNDVERGIRAAWGLGAIVISAGVVTYMLRIAGFVFLPASPQLLDYMRACAFLTACANILFWVLFPLEDLRVLRTWIRVRKSAFASHTSELLMMMSASLLLIILVISSTVNAALFGIVGSAIYILNLLGFAVIRTQVSKAVSEARTNYSKEPTVDKRNYLLAALKTIEKHWSISKTDGRLRNRQQIRHASLTIAFLGVALLGLIARAIGNSLIEAVAYLSGALTLVAAEVSIAIWRTSRDRSLHGIFEELRSIHSRTPEEAPS